MGFKAPTPPRDPHLHVIYYWLDFLEGRDFITQWVPQYEFELEHNVDVRMQMSAFKQLCKLEILDPEANDAN
jgi:hypothetical protein